MRKHLITAIVVVIMVSSAMAGQGEFRGFAISGKQLTENVSFTSVNFIVRNALGTNVWSFNGPRLSFGQGGFVDGFVGMNFSDSGKVTYALSPRLRLPMGRFYLWQDVEWYPEKGDWYTASVLHWRADPKAGPGEGLEFGFELEMFAPGDTPNIIWHAGPFANFNINEKFGICLAWHKKQEQFGGNFFRITTTFLFF